MIHGVVIAKECNAKIKCSACRKTLASGVYERNIMHHANTIQEHAKVCSGRPSFWRTALAGIIAAATFRRRSVL